MQKEQGFTLIECLVVIAIFSILIAMSYPHYQHHLQNAYCEQGKHHLHQIGAELEHYAAIHGSYLKAKLNDLPLPSVNQDTHYQYQLIKLTADHYTITATALSPSMVSTQPTCQQLSLTETNQITSLSGKNPNQR